MSTVRDQVVEIFREVLDNPDLELGDGSVARDVEGWDSLAHINLMFSVEQEFGITFSDREMGSMVNFGELVRAVEAKLG
ncbi:acyl carrier protein [Propioniciclava soli]|uniref:Acyl carrier protein n=1 Tax=Propioniciclava soli TaxID=2775081 RepID=A0ABZ3C539_9ACTN